jgi:hypothetical protein
MGTILTTAPQILEKCCDLGDLLSPTTSTLQKQGNVVVGGNIGNFNITGNEVGVIYAVNPNATVAITPSGLNQKYYTSYQ